MSKGLKTMDLNQLAKRIIDAVIGEEPITILPEEEQKAEQERKRLVRLKEGKVRTNKLTAAWRTLSVSRSRGYIS